MTAWFRKGCVVSLVLAACLSGGPVSADSRTVTVDRVVASIEGVGVITSLQLMQYSAVSAVMDDGEEKAVEELRDKSYLRASLTRLIDRMLLLKDAQLLSIKPPAKSAIDDMVARFRAKFKSPADCDGFMKQYALGTDYLGRFMSEELMVKQYTDEEVRMMVHVSYRDVVSYYKNNEGSYGDMSRQDAEKKIRAMLEQREYDRQLKSWIKTLTLHREIIIQY